MDTRHLALSPDLEAALVELGGKLARGENLAGDLDEALDLMGEMSPAEVAQADTAIATAAGTLPPTPHVVARGLGVLPIDRLSTTPSFCSACRNSNTFSFFIETVASAKLPF